jgi:hypothetical protein
MRLGNSSEVKINWSPFAKCKNETVPRSIVDNPKIRDLFRNTDRESTISHPELVSGSRLFIIPECPYRKYSSLKTLVGAAFSHDSSSSLPTKGKDRTVVSPFTYSSKRSRSHCLSGVAFFTVRSFLSSGDSTKCDSVGGWRSLEFVEGRTGLAPAETIKGSCRCEARLKSLKFVGRILQIIRKRNIAIAALENSALKP